MTELAVPKIISRRVDKVSKSMHLHYKHVVQIGSNVHFASRAAQLVGDKSAFKVHQEAGCAKHDWTDILEDDCCLYFILLF